MVRNAFVKVGMTSAFTEAGEAQGVTVLRLQPAKVVRHESLQDGRTLVVVEYDTGAKRRQLVVGQFKTPQISLSVPQLARQLSPLDNS